MAVAIDATSGISKSANGATSLTVSHTAAGSATYLLSFGWDWQADTFTGVTANGSAMTQLIKQTRNPDSGSLEAYIYGLGSPPTGTYNVVFSRSGTSNWINGGSVSLTGSSTSTTPQATLDDQHSNPAGTSNTIAFTAGAADCAVLVSDVADNASCAASTNLTELVTETADTTIICRSSTFPQTSSGSVSYTNTFGNNSGGVQLAVAIAPASSGPANLKSYDGNVKSNIKSVNGNTLANMKSLSGNA